MSRRAHKPDEISVKQVDAMAAYGVPEHAIARVLKISPKTLRKHYKEELETAHIKANSAVAQSLFRKATGDGPQSVTAAIFWAKTRMGWKEPASEAEIALGKKEIQSKLADSAGQGTDWGDDLASNVVALRK